MLELYLSKILPIFVYPIGLTLSLLLLAGTLRLIRWRRSAFVSSALAIGILWIASMPVAGNFLYGQLERQYPPLATVDVPNADVVIVLGGALSPPEYSRKLPTLNGAIDRVLFASRLYRAGKAPVILVSAGHIPWDRPVRSEAEWIADLLVEWGVPQSALILDTESRNTAENAANTKRLMAQHGLHTGLLVTSAGHMPRALSLFRMAGIDVTPCSTDVRTTSGQDGTVFDWLPDVGALELTTLAVKEWLGMAVNAVRAPNRS